MSTLTHRAAAITIACCALLPAGCGTTNAGCTSDLDCKGTRICVRGACEEPTPTGGSGGGSAGGTGGSGGGQAPGGCSPLCDASAVCVDDNGSPRCFPKCQNATQCASGCCALTTSGAQVCADSSFCISSGSCNPTCATNQKCVLDNGNPVCAGFCSSGTDCATGCCAVAGSDRVCAPSSYCPAGTGQCLAPSQVGRCTNTADLYCEPGACCDASLPFYCPATQRCHATEGGATGSCGAAVCRRCANSCPALLTCYQASVYNDNVGGCGTTVTSTVLRINNGCGVPLRCCWQFGSGAKQCAGVGDVVAASRCGANQTVRYNCVLGTTDFKCAEIL